MAKKKNNTELVVVDDNKLSPEFLEIAEKGGLDISEASQIGLKFAPFMQFVNERAALIDQLDGENPTKEMADLAKKYRLELVSNRGINGMKPVKESLKERILIVGRLIDNYHNLVENSSKLSESKAETIEKHQERVQAKALQAIADERIAKLSEFGEVSQYIDFKSMDDASFEKMYSNEKIAFEAKQRREKEEQERRIKEEKEAKEKEAAKEKLVKDRTKLLVDAGIQFDGEVFRAGKCVIIALEDLHKKDEDLFNKIMSKGIEFANEEKAEAERIRLENEELKKKEELHKKRNIQLACYINLIRDYEKTLNLPEDEYQKELKDLEIGYNQQKEYEAEEEKKKNAAAERLAKENYDLKKREDERMAKEKEDKERKEAEAEKERKAEMLKGDKERVNELYVSIRDLPIPEFKTNEAKHIGESVRSSIELILQGIKDLALHVK